MEKFHTYLKDKLMDQMLVKPFKELVVQEVINEKLKALEKELVDLLREKDEHIAFLYAQLEQKEGEQK